MRKIIFIWVLTYCLSLSYAQAKEYIETYSINYKPGLEVIEFSVLHQEIKEQHLTKDAEIIKNFNKLNVKKENMLNVLKDFSIDGKLYFGGKYLNMAFDKNEYIDNYLPLCLSSSLCRAEKGIQFTAPSFKANNFFVTSIKDRIEIAAPPGSKGWLKKVIITPMSQLREQPFTLMLDGKINFDPSLISRGFRVVGAKKIEFWIKRSLYTKPLSIANKENLSNLPRENKKKEGLQNRKEIRSVLGNISINL